MKRLEHPLVDGMTVIVVLLLYSIITTVCMAHLLRQRGAARAIAVDAFIHFDACIDLTKRYAAMLDEYIEAYGKLRRDAQQIYDDETEAEKCCSRTYRRGS